MGAIIVVDAFWGDSGKGKIASYLAETAGATMCIRAGTGTNAGHSIYIGDRILKTHQIPLSGILSGARLRVGSGVAVDPAVFTNEINSFSEYRVAERVKIDFRCPVILPEYISREKSDTHFTGVVGSTCSGTGVAQAEFCLRRARQAKDIKELQPFVSDVAHEANAACRAGETIVVEGSQGTFLSLALTGEYPFCTSGNCTTSAFIDDIGLNWRYISEVVLVVKALPSRVGEGPLPFEISLSEQDKRGIAEFGVRTGRRRRKADRIPMDLLEESVMLNGPTRIALTFCDHWDPHVRVSGELTPKVLSLAEDIEKTTGVPVTLFDIGKEYNSIVRG